MPLPPPTGTPSKNYAVRCRHSEDLLLPAPAKEKAKENDKVKGKGNDGGNDKGNDGGNDKGNDGGNDKGNNGGNDKEMTEEMTKK